MGVNKISSSAIPSTDLVNKKYLDEYLARRLNNDDTMTRRLNDDDNHE